MYAENKESKKLNEFTFGTKELYTIIKLLRQKSVLFLQDTRCILRYISKNCLRIKVILIISVKNGLSKWNLNRKNYINKHIKNCDRNIFLTSLLFYYEYKTYLNDATLEHLMGTADQMVGKPVRGREAEFPVLAATVRGKENIITERLYF